MDINHKEHNRNQVVESQSTYGHDFLTTERVILGNIQDEILGREILDIGVGGGRTTLHLLALSSRYVGIGYSE